MAEKRATVYVIDLGKDMGYKNGNRAETDLEYTEHYLWDRITSTVANGRKTDNVSVIGYRTAESDNALAKDDENYLNISILSPMGQFLMPTIRELNKRMTLSNTTSGDGVSAIVVAIDAIERFCRKLKYDRNIVVLTNGLGSYDFEGIEDIVKKVKEQGIKIMILGVDFDDEEYGFKEEGKSPKKAQIEASLKEFCDACGGTFGTLEEAIEELKRPRTKPVRPVHSFRGQMTIGDPSGSMDLPVLSIDVERYPKTMVAKPVSASSFAMGGVKNPAASEEQEIMDETSAASGLHQVRVARVYQVDDKEAPGGKQDVEKEELSKGYTFGRTVVPVSASDEEVVQLETYMGLEIIGFFANENFMRFFNMGNTCQIVPAKANDKAAIALSSFIHALYELDSIALARLVTKDGRPPSLRVLAPSIEPDFECLIDIQVPFAEDIRHYKFAPFDHVKTVSGKVLDNHRLIPSEDLVESMSDYIDSMELSQDDTASTQYFSPLLHRVNQCIAFRATHPGQTDKLPEVYPILMAPSQPSSSLKEESKDDLVRLIELSEVKKVPPRTKGRQSRVDGAKQPLSGLDVEGLLRQRIETARIDPQNAIAEFKQLIENLPDASVDNLRDVFEQMSSIVKMQVTNSLGSSSYGTTLEHIKVMRHEALDVEEPQLFNTFIEDFKGSMIRGDFGSDRKDIWSGIRANKLGLLTSDDSSKSSKTAEDGRKFYFTDFS